MRATTSKLRFYRDAAQMLKGFDETIGRFQVGSGIARQLKVGMGPALSRRMLLRAIPAFQERHPEIQIVLLSINERVQIEDEAVDVLVRPRSTRQSVSSIASPRV